ncbi:MAG: RNase adapter RapZ [Desulfatibacillaceae bacterium]|nr:RNase adapter RapZ [Desulfatibacillaceae bacterium]
MQKPAIIIVTGLSGSGKSTALAALEDAGFFCVDNLPVALLPQLLKLHEGKDLAPSRFAFGMDLREEGFLSRYNKIFSRLKKKGYGLEMLFLEASDQALLRRYSETRRHHPLTSEKGLLDSIRTERQRLAPVRRAADQVVDTSAYNIHELKASIRDMVCKSAPLRKMEINVLSFGFKYGAPMDADLVMDVRFLPNPHFVPELRPLNGEDESVRCFVMEREETRQFLTRFLDLLDYLIPRYEAEGKAYLTVAIGCTGGQHRSVSVAWKVFEHFKGQNRDVALTHRDIRPGTQKAPAP